MPSCAGHVLTAGWQHVHTHAIPGTSFGQRLRAAITSYKNEAVSVKGTIRLIRDMFGVYLSA